mmetsp:Transcript_1301/g.4469  ORF Transcript_1301/g.4469 Transcript_1301/m.4469 type:complete len:83 (+) Transcript_1301:2484-2732(+)
MADVQRKTIVNVCQITQDQIVQFLGVETCLPVTMQYATRMETALLRIFANATQTTLRMTAHFSFAVLYSAHLLGFAVDEDHA